MHDSEMVQKVLKALARHGDGEPVPPERLNIRDVLYVVNQDDPGSVRQSSPSQLDSSTTNIIVAVDASFRTGFSFSTGSISQRSRNTLRDRER